jgi:hypothetical protein
MKKAIMILSLITVMCAFSVPAKVEAKEVVCNPISVLNKTVADDVFYYCICTHCRIAWGSRTPPATHHCIGCGSWWIMCMSTFLTD